MQRGAKIALASGIVIAGLAGASLFRKPAKPAASADAEPAPIDRAATSLVEHDPADAARLSDRVDPVSAAAESLAPSSSADAGRSPSPPRKAADVQAAPQSQHADEHDESPVDRAGRTPPRRRGRTHRVRDGDTLSLLAADYLGSSQRYLEIFEANRDLLKNPDLLPIGAELKIPSLDEIARAKPPQAAIERPMAPLATPPSPPAPPPQGMKRTYRVKTGDTLVAIAKQFYGDGERYQEIYEANRERLQVPDDLREGLVLDIP